MNTRELQRLLDKEEFPLQIEVVRLSLAAVLSRMESELELQEIDPIINNLWSFSTDELFGMSVDQIRGGDYTPVQVGGVFRKIRRYVDEWEDESGRPKTYYVAYGVTRMLLSVIWYLSGSKDAGKYLVESVSTAAYAFEDEDSQCYRWFLDVILDNYQKLKNLQA